MAVPVSDQPGHKVFATCPFNRLFARGEHLGNTDDIGIIEARAKILEERREPRADCDENYVALSGLANSPRRGGVDL